MTGIKNIPCLPKLRTKLSAPLPNAMYNPMYIVWKPKARNITLYTLNDFDPIRSTSASFEKIDTIGLANIISKMLIKIQNMVVHINAVRRVFLSLSKFLAP